VLLAEANQSPSSSSSSPRPPVKAIRGRVHDVHAVYAICCAAVHIYEYVDTTVCSLESL